MSYPVLLILGSFTLVAVGVVVVAVGVFRPQRQQQLERASYWLLSVGSLMYLVASVMVWSDGLAWSVFKAQLLVLLLVFVVYHLAYHLAKQQRLVRYLALLLLIVVIAWMHFHWSGLL
ncbi:hypothetical protein HY933_02890 [Candidatus Falkowbacteria bacterium]|nr:hypothetical protein [Candidatus Falkowbacteria bacterium]